MAPFQPATGQGKTNSRSVVRLLVVVGAIMWALISVLVAAWLVKG